MSDDAAPYPRLRAIIGAAAGGEIDAGDFAVVLSLVPDLSEREIAAVLDEYFDIEPLILAIFERFRDRRSEWHREVRQQLLEALVFCGYDEAAQHVASVQATSGA